jgi:hypothetical protein
MQPLKNYVLLLLLMVLFITCQSPKRPIFQNFITCRGDKLMNGEKEFRFISFNIPNLHYVEDDMRFEQTMHFRFPNEYEITDALKSIKQMGGQVVRIYTLSVRKTDDPENMPRHIL